MILERKKAVAKALIWEQTWTCSRNERPVCLKRSDQGESASRLGWRRRQVQVMQSFEDHKKAFRFFFSEALENLKQRYDVIIIKF